MTLCFHSVEPISQNQKWHYISIKFARRQHQLDVRQLVFGWVHQNCNTPVVIPVQFVVIIKKLFIELWKLFSADCIIIHLFIIPMLCILLLSLLYEVVLLLYTSNSLFKAFSHSKISKVIPYSLLSGGHGADPGVQAVSPQVTLSHPPGGRLSLLSTRWLPS